MESFYILLFGLAATLAAALEWGNRRGAAASGRAAAAAGGAEPGPDFRRFRANYLTVYCLMMAGDWMQGPFVYALYQHYGFGRGEIGRLFIAGFGSSLVFGTVVGALADRHGRRRAALTYAATYVVGCATKHVNSFWVLFMGRVFCGVATSLLYSAFEAWLVAEHFRRGFPAEWLGGTFSAAVFLGNGLMAIVSGLFAHALVETAGLGPVAPFDAAAAVLLAGGALVAATWPENYGDAAAAAAAGGGGASGGGRRPGAAGGAAGALAEQFRRAAGVIARDEKVALLGAMQSLFEGAMYSFVFLWTPALSPRGEAVPHGMIFACFMASSMVGSAAAGRLLARGGGAAAAGAAGGGKGAVPGPERYMQAVFAVASASLLVPTLVHQWGGDGAAAAAPGGGLSPGGKAQLAAFCVFEVCVGLFWPSMMTMRAAHVPEEARATIINLFRIPLNLFVCVVLANVAAVPLEAMFALCAGFLAACAACQRRFASILHCERAGSHFNEDPLPGAFAKLAGSPDGLELAGGAGQVTRRARRWARV